MSLNIRVLGLTELVVNNITSPWSVRAANRKSLSGSREVGRGRGRHHHRGTRNYRIGFVIIARISSSLVFGPWFGPCPLSVANTVA